MEAYLPPSLALDHASRHLEETAWAVPTHNLLYRTSRTPDLLAVLAVKEMLEAIEREVRPRGSRIERPFLLLLPLLVLRSRAAVDGGGDVSAGATDVCVGESHDWKLRFRLPNTLAIDMKLINVVILYD